MIIVNKIVICLFIISFTAHMSAAAQNSPLRLPGGEIVLENFEDDPTGGLPGSWYDRDGNKKLSEHSQDFLQGYKYTVQEKGGNKYLHYEGMEAKHINLPLINEKRENIYNINIFETPVLSWKVRAHNLPQNANEEDNERNDAVASVYVVFDFGRIALFKKVPKTIRYTWSTTMKEGARTSKLFGNQNIIVVKSGTDDLGEWVTFNRNLVEDYRAVFGDKPPKTPLAILILSDGDSTGSFVMADYDDIMLKPLDK